VAGSSTLVRPRRHDLAGMDEEAPKSNARSAHGSAGRQADPLLAERSPEHQIYAGGKAPDLPSRTRCGGEAGSVQEPGVGDVQGLMGEVAQPRLLAPAVESGVGPGRLEDDP